MHKIKKNFGISRDKLKSSEIKSRIKIKWPRSRETIPYWIEVTYNLVYLNLN